MATYKALVLEQCGTSLVLKDVQTPPVTLGSALVAPLYAMIPPLLPVLLSGAFKEQVSLSRKKFCIAPTFDSTLH